MNKRSAMLLAAGLVAALLAAGTVVSFSLSGQTASANDAGEPLVLTRHRTVTVHRKADAGGVRTVALPGSAGIVSSGSDEEFEGEFEGEFEDEHGEEHEFDDSPGSENSGPGSVNSGSGSEGSGGDD